MTSKKIVKDYDCQHILSRVQALHEYTVIGAYCSYKNPDGESWNSEIIIDSLRFIARGLGFSLVPLMKDEEERFVDAALNAWRETNAKKL